MFEVGIYSEKKNPPKRPFSNVFWFRTPCGILDKSTVKNILITDLSSILTATKTFWYFTTGFLMRYFIRIMFVEFLFNFITLFEVMNMFHEFFGIFKKNFKIISILFLNFSLRGDGSIIRRVNIFDNYRIL